MVGFTEFAKIPRLFRDCVVTEKIDGTNASICILDRFDEMDTSGSVCQSPTQVMWAGSRTRWVTPDADNFGFARWVQEHAEELFALGVGHHFGEWWGQGIQRKYGQDRKRFSLFNVSRWGDGAETPRPACCDVVPVLYRGLFDTAAIRAQITYLAATGSQAAPGFMKPEGIVVWHDAARILFKSTIEKDESPKGARR